ncbi:hypothetical protein [Paraburkholderia xenovorans]
MIPDIGVMIGLYIITRMIVVAFDPAQRTVSKIFSWITVVTALICIVDLLSKGSQAFPGRLP